MKISLRRRHAQMVGDGAFSHKIDRTWKFLKILNLKRHQHCTIGSKVTAILLNGWVLSIGGVASGRACTCSLHSKACLCSITVLRYYGGWNGYNWISLRRQRCALVTVFWPFCYLTAAMFCEIGNPYLSDNSCCLVYLRSNKTVPGENCKYSYHYNSRVEEGFCNIK